MTEIEIKRGKGKKELAKLEKKIFILSRQQKIENSGRRQRAEIIKQNGGTEVAKRKK